MAPAAWTVFDRHWTASSAVLALLLERLSKAVNTAGREPSWSDIRRPTLCMEMSKSAENYNVASLSLVSTEEGACLRMERGRGIHSGSVELVSSHQVTQASAQARLASMMRTRIAKSNLTYVMYHVDDLKMIFEALQMFSRLQISHLQCLL